jgi:hypothetical protein
VLLEVIEASSQATQLMIDEVKTLIHSTTAETHLLIVDGDRQTRREMRMLREDLVGRLALLAEARPRRRR